MEPLIRISSVVAPLLRDNVDTDAIIPAGYMRSLSIDLATGLFARWRYRPDGTEAPEFVLNDARYRNARILLSGANFGCGSSREHAVWALHGFGIRCVIALSFSDIFYENAFKNGLLPIRLAPADHALLVAQASAARPLHASVDVEARRIETSAGSVIGFDLDARKQSILLTGEDEIAATLRRYGEIAAFRERHRERAPWLYAAGPAE